MTDAELSIGVSDEFTPALAKMQGAATEFAKTTGIAYDEVIKYHARLEKSLGTFATKAPALNAASIMGDQGALKRDVEASTKAQQGYNNSILELAKIRKEDTGAVRDTETGRFVSKADALKREESALDSMSQAQQRYAQQESANATRASEHNQRQLANLRETGAQSARTRDDLQSMYNTMFNAKEPFPKNIFAGAEKGLGSIMNASNGVRYALYDVSRTATVAGAALIGVGLLGVGMAAKWEHAFAQVDRVTEGSRAQLEAVRQSLIGLSVSMPVGFTALTQIASDAGQLGISRGGIAAFTETVAKMTATTSLSAEAAGRALGRFKAFFPVIEGGDRTLAVTEQTFGNLASSILKVGVNSVATETGIVNVATQISSMGSYAGMTADQVVGLAGAMSSIGVPPELSRGVLTRLFTTMGGAVSQGGIRLEKFAEISGVSSREFAAAWQTENFAPMLNKFTEGLNKLANGGGDANAALRELGITSVRDVPTLLRLAKAADSAGVAGGLLAQTLGDARSGWRNNTELAIQYTKVSSTLTSRLSILGNSFEALLATMGESSIGPAKDLVSLFTDMVQAVTRVAASPMMQWLGPVAAGLGILVGTLLLVVGGMSRMAAAAQGVGAAIAALKGVTELSTIAIRNLSRAMLFTGIGVVLAGIGLAFAAITMSADETGDAIKSIDMGSLLAAMQKDSAAGAGGMKFFAQRVGEAADEQDRNRESARGLAKALGQDVADGADRATGALDSADAATKRLRYTFGPSARDIVRDAAMMDKGLQEVFSNMDFANMFQKSGLTIDKLIDVSAAGGDLRKTMDEAFKTLPDYKAGIGWTAFLKTQGLNDFEVEGMYREIEGSLAGIEKELQGAINLRGLLGGTEEVIAEYEEMFNSLDEVGQKAVEKNATAMAKFVDPKSLIKLTQETVEASKLVGEEGAKAAADLEKSWVDAYGGTSFAIGDYMSVFRRASEEQLTQVANLQELAARGVDQAIIRDLADMGPEGVQLVKALVDGTQDQLTEFVDLWGRTGYDSQIALAVQAAVAQDVVNNVFAEGGMNALREFNSRLAGGSGVAEALGQMQRHVDGTLIKVKPELESTRVRNQWIAWAQSQEAQLRLPVTPYLTKTSVGVIANSGSTGNYAFKLYDQGGYTGNGGKYDPAGIVHRGEFVMDKESTSRIGVGPLYAMMRAAKGGSPAPRPGGYAGGGSVEGAGGGIVQLSPADRALLVDIRQAVGINIQAQSLEAVVRGGNMNDSKRRSG